VNNSWVFVKFCFAEGSIMETDRLLKALHSLLPAGALGISVTLASIPANAMAVTRPDIGNAKVEQPVAARLQAIRQGVSAVIGTASTGTVENPNIVKVWWGNGGWGNGGWGWHNGWHNGGWGNGWHNGGWGNGWGNGWHNGGWGNGWHNGWGNW
jgi:rSAM-associated Gly-rich repeat protein